MATTRKKPESKPNDNKPPEEVDEKPGIESERDPNHAVVLTKDHGRSFVPSPVGAIFTFAFENGTGLKVWQHPASSSQHTPAADETAERTVSTWRVRHLDGDGHPIPLRGNPDRTYSTAEVNALVASLAVTSPESDA